VKVAQCAMYSSNACCNASGLSILRGRPFM